jgi:hypothetical protein
MQTPAHLACNKVQRLMHALMPEQAKAPIRTMRMRTAVRTTADAAPATASRWPRTLLVSASLLALPAL